MFENLTSKFEEIFSSLKKAPSLDEAQVDEGLRGIRQALLEADVSLDVAKNFIEKIVASGIESSIVYDVLEKVDKNEYKRKQVAPGVKLTERAFGKDRRMPITNTYIRERFL